ncbi:Beta-ketoacyl-[acyl-carrier-protein] synthase II [Candidatus Johnevansia muelleri]|uniref:Beta-ketoacyl-ACP synthase II n=1 Tax=Candidatus Johnevansia muelleri TaxID=1495769 RepID=A0A078KHZ5_9GAMM|nr:Beta-ketoacyl-[acyl-carrier-protein] synthase II [Candidatus Evansia muelleri]
MITPIGNTVSETWNNIKSGKSGISAVETFNFFEFNTSLMGAIKNFDSSIYLKKKYARRMDLFIQYGLAAGIQAIKDSGLENTEINYNRIGIAIGSGFGGLSMIEINYNAINNGVSNNIYPFFVPGSIINMLSGTLAIQYGFKGPNIAISTACTTGAHNIGYGARTIVYGDADIMLCGGAEAAAVSTLGLLGFSAVKVLSNRNDDPEKASRPWDRDRDGFVISDGAGVVVLEEYEHAKKRGAVIYAEIKGFGMSNDAYHVTAPNINGAELAMRNAIADAGINLNQIHYINAHGTSTQLGDIAESKAIERIFKNVSPPISSTKSMSGHLLGAAGAVEAIFSILAIKDQVAPPTINLDYPGDGCTLDYIPHTARDMKIENVMSNSFGFGGTNGSLIFSRI